MKICEINETKVVFEKQKSFLRIKNMDESEQFINLLIERIHNNIIL